MSLCVVWSCLQVITGSSTPIQVELSVGQRTTNRGDVFLLWKQSQYDLGDIVVFNIEDRYIPIVHRIVQCHTNQNGDQRILTKGDDNAVDDAYGIYKPGQMWISQHDIQGKVIFYAPQVGLICIWLLEEPLVKYWIMIAILIYHYGGYIMEAIWNGMVNIFRKLCRWDFDILHYGLICCLIVSWIVMWNW